ncbi:MAG: HAD hydrolase-like protein [Nanoarchaeota archaeon]|nr:HAD hydrolase-like protein [Nanoarchaeota archaeon]
MIKVIYFDIGGVIVTDGFARAASLFSKELNIDEEKLFDAYIKTDDWKYSAGKIGIERWDNFFKELNLKNIDVQKFVDLWHSIFVPIDETISLIQKLHGKYLLGILADQPKDILPYFERYSFLDLFDLRVISCEVGHSKDEGNLNIYEIAVDLAKVKSEEILFIDNNQKNLDNAAKLGIKTLLYKNNEQLKKELVSFSIKLN